MASTLQKPGWWERSKWQSVIPTTVLGSENKHLIISSPISGRTLTPNKWLSRCRTPKTSLHIIHSFVVQFPTSTWLFCPGFILSWLVAPCEYHLCIPCPSTSETATKKKCGSHRISKKGVPVQLKLLLLTAECQRPSAPFWVPTATKINVLWCLDTKISQLQPNNVDEQNPAPVDIATVNIAFCIVYSIVFEPSPLLQDFVHQQLLQVATFLLLRWCADPFPSGKNSRYASWKFRFWNKDMMCLVLIVTVSWKWIACIYACNHSEIMNAS